MGRIIDLTQPLVAGDPGVTVEPAKRIETDGWNATVIGLYSHCGTHIDAPAHFGVNEQTIEDYPVERLIGLAWLVDVRPVEPRGMIEPRHLGPVADDFQNGDSLLVRTGWSQYYGQAEYRDALPRISEDLARWCAEKGVCMLGVETPSVADVNHIEELTKVHEILLEAGVIIVEGLANLDQITTNRVTLIALPLKVVGGDGAPARVIAIEDDEAD